MNSIQKMEQQNKQNKYYSIWKILLPLSVSYLAIGLSQNGFFSLLPFIREEFVLTKAQTGYYSTIYFISAAILSIFSGNIVDKFGPKKSILWGMSFRAAILFLHGLSFSYQTLLYQAIFAGLSISIITPSIIKGTTIASPPEKKAFYLGLVQSGYSVGSIAGASLLPIFAINFNWKLSVQSSAIFVFITFLLVYFFYLENKKTNHNIVNINMADSIKNSSDGIHKTDSALSFKESLLIILKNKPLFKICVLGMIFGVSEGSVCTHFAMFLSEDLRMGKVIAGLGFACIYIGGIIGMAGWGWISDHFFRKNRRLNLFIIGSFISIMFIIFSLFPNNNQTNHFLIIVLTFFLGSVTIGWPGAYLVVVGEFAGEKHSGMATGLSLFFIRTGVFLAPIGFGYIADLKGSYQYSWLSFGILIIIVSSMFLLVKNKENLNVKSLSRT